MVRRAPELLLLLLCATPVAAQSSPQASESTSEPRRPAYTDRRFDEIIVATLPRPVSHWLRADLPRRAERRFGLPVTTIITRRWP